MLPQRKESNLRAGRDQNYVCNFQIQQVLFRVEGDR